MKSKKTTEMNLGYIEDLETHLASVEQESEHKNLEVRKFMREVTNLLRDKEEMQRSVNALEGEVAQTPKGATGHPLASLRGLNRLPGTSTLSVQVFENKSHDMDVSLTRLFGLPQLRSRTLTDPVFSTTSVGLRTLPSFKTSTLLMPSPLSGTPPASPLRQLTPLSSGPSPLSRASPYSPNLFHFSFQQDLDRETVSNREDVDGSSTHLDINSKAPDVISRTLDFGRPFRLPNLTDEFTLHLPVSENTELVISDLEEPRRMSLGSSTPEPASGKSVQDLTGDSVDSLRSSLVLDRSESMEEVVEMSKNLHQTVADADSSDPIVVDPSITVLETNSDFPSSNCLVPPRSGLTTPHKRRSTSSGDMNEEPNHLPNLGTLDDELSRVSCEADSVTDGPEPHDNATLSHIQIPQQDINQLAAQYSMHSSAIDVISGLAYCIFAAPPILIRNAVVASFRFVARCAKYTLIASVLSVVSVDDINEVYSSRHKVPVAA